MRVLLDHQIFSSQPQGGVSRYFTELIKGYNQYDLEVNSAWLYTANRYLHEWNPEKFRDWLPTVHFKGKAHLTHFVNGFVSRQALSSGAWDVFHPTYFDPYFLPLLKRKPFVLTIHDMTHELYPEGLSDRHFLPGRKRLLAQKASQVICVSENTRQDAIRILDLDPQKVVTIPHGNSLRPGNIQPVAPQEEGYWLYVGSRADYKNWDILVTALASRSAPEDRLVMVGGGPLSRSESRALLKAGLDGRFFHRSASDGELAGWYQRAKALVYTSRYEGFGMPIIEAMAWGCPVVAARASCLPEIGGDAALYFDPDSADELVHALAQVSDQTFRSESVSRGLEQVKAFTWAASVEKTMEVYRSCV